MNDFSNYRHVALPLTLLAALAACSSANESTTTSSSGTTSGSGGATAASSSASSGAGGASSCPQAATMLDGSKAPGAGASYDKPTLSAKCTDTSFVVDSNGMPPYNFVQTTPNALKVQAEHYEIPIAPKKADTTTTIPLLAIVGFAVNGIAFYGPNEASIPADEAFGDPVANGLMDACFGHTSPQEYHYHSMLEQCLVASGLVAEPWTNPAPDAKTASPIIGWALDGFPIYGSRECTDASCAAVQTLQSGYEKVGDPKTYAWKAYAWKEHAADATYLDECNGHTGPDGTYHYHLTATFPYILGCYHGTAASSGGSGSSSSGMGMATSSSGGMMGPKSCSMESDCAGACPPSSKGCTCSNSPMGMICVPTCSTDADCPMGMMGMSLTCKQGVCAP